MMREEHLRKIKEADAAYYDTAESIMSDEEYDALRNSYIQAYGSGDLDYVPGGAITKRKFKHPIPVTSLAKVDIDDVMKLRAEETRLHPIVLEPKYDGLTVVAYPQEDGSYQYVTRGSGVEGDILPWFPEQARKIYEKPKVAYAVRGEAFMTPFNFDRMNQVLIERGEQPKANPRNAAAGILNPARKEKSEFLNLIDYYCYDVIGMDKPDHLKLKYIIENTPFHATGCLIPPNTKTIEEAARDYYEDLITENCFPIDGIVMKSCSDKKFGSTAHHPRNAVAIKNTQEVHMTTLRLVNWQVGKTGAVTPVAYFDPVEILGSKVSQASLSNPSEIERLGLHIGDRIGVIKAREIIPKIVLNEGGGDELVVPPSHCPTCGSELHYEGPVLYCENQDCEEMIVRQMEFLTRKDVLNIQGLSIESCRKLVLLYPELVYNFGPYMLFYLSKEQIYGAFGDGKLGHNIHDALQSCMTHPHEFQNWIPALLLDKVGHHVADILLRHYRSTDKVVDALFDIRDEEELSSIPGIGPVIAKTLCSDECEDHWGALEEHVPFRYVNRDQETSSVFHELPYAGFTFVLTGKMPKKRSEYEKMISEGGGKVANSVSKNTDFLVIADVNSTSTKAQKARQLGTILISPEELEEMMKE